MSLQSLLMIKKKDHVVPLAYLQEVLKNFPSAMGVAFVSDEKQLVIDNFDGEMPSEEDVVSIFEELKSRSVLVVFGAADGPSLNIDDIMPFSILENKEGNPILAMAIEGDLSEFADEKSTHSEAFLALVDQIQPWFKDQFKLCDGNIGALMTKLNDEPRLKREFEKVLGAKGGSAVLLSEAGEIYQVKKTDTDGSFDWGWTSFNFAPKAAPAAEESKKISIFDRVKNKVGGIKPVPGDAMVKPEAKSSTPPVKQDNKPVIANQQKEETKTEAKVPVVEPEFAMVGPPPENLNNKGIRNFYKANAGYIPENWKKRPVVQSRIPKALKDFSELKQTTESVNDQMKKAAEEPVVEPKKSDVAPKYVSKDNKPLVKTTREAVPVLSKEQKESFLKGHIQDLELVDGNSFKIPSPEDIQKMETKFPTFSDQVGISGLENTFHWSYDTILKMAREHPEAMAVYVFNMRRHYMNELASKPQPKKEATQQQTSAPSSVKSSRFPGLRKTA